MYTFLLHTERNTCLEYNVSVLCELLYNGLLVYESTFDQMTSRLQNTELKPPKNFLLKINVLFHFNTYTSPPMRAKRYP